MVVPLGDVEIARVVESEVDRELQLGFVRGPPRPPNPDRPVPTTVLIVPGATFGGQLPSAFDARRCSPSSPPHPPATVPAIAATAIQAFTGTERLTS
jgi:hypothetical protein